MCPLHAATSDVSAWAPYEPNEAAPWNLERVVHLHRRAGFAAPWAQLQRDLNDGPDPAIDRMLRGQASDASASFESMASTIGDAAMASGSPGRLQAWWLYRMLLTPDPLGERLTLMWHNHFATSNRKVRDLVRMREQNDLLRTHARGPFGELLSAVLRHPAMLVWLDADSNRRGHPNENLAREAMELFTIGIGHYTEHDVQEAARALTGWSIVNNRFAFVEARHDDGEKTVLGKTERFSGDDFLRAITQHPATSQRIAWRLCHTFMGEGVVDDVALSQLADGLAAHNLDIGWAVGTMLRSQRFFSQQNIRSRVSSPVEYVIGALRALELCDAPPSTLLLADWTTRMGQELFYPPNVGGWSEGRTWLTSRTIVARANFASALVEGKLWHPPHVPNVAEVLSHHDQPTQFDKAIDWITRLLWGIDVPPPVQEALRSDELLNKDQPISTALALLLRAPNINWHERPWHLVGGIDMLSRRKFLQTSSLVSLSPMLPRLLGNTARAAGAAPDARALVVIQLDGGNDGLNTVVPFADDGYGRNRDKLRLELDKLYKLDDHVALHPSMRAAKDLYDDGRLCVVQGVGYPNPDRSHFRSMRIWQTATFDDDRHDSYGWLGTALDTTAKPIAIYVGDQETPVALWSRRSTATAVSTADDLKLSLAIPPTAVTPTVADTSSDLRQFVARQVLSAYATADEFARRQSGLSATGQGNYPDSSLAAHLKLVAQVLKSGAESRVYYTIQSGYDTHSSQLYTHSRLLREFADALKAFLDDLKSAGLDDQVVVLAFSEFGRRVKENDSQGTDHGTAGPVFLAGTPVKGGLVGNAPDLANLDGGDLKMQMDFRQVYAALLDDWLGVNSASVLGASFERPLVLSS